jgi:hypothetical protein
MTSKRVASLAARQTRKGPTKAERSVAASALSDRKKLRRKLCRKKADRKATGRRSTRR